MKGFPKKISISYKTSFPFVTSSKSDLFSSICKCRQKKKKKKNRSRIRMIENILKLNTYCKLYRIDINKPSLSFPCTPYVKHM